MLGQVHITLLWISIPYREKWQYFSHFMHMYPDLSDPKDLNELLTVFVKVTASCKLVLKSGYRVHALRFLNNSCKNACHVVHVMFCMRFPCTYVSRSHYLFMSYQPTAFLDTLNHSHVR